MECVGTQNINSLLRNKNSKKQNVEVLFVFVPNSNMTLTTQFNFASRCTVHPLQLHVLNWVGDAVGSKHF